MKMWLENLRRKKGQQNLFILILFGLFFLLPEQYLLTNFAYAIILFLIAYISAYIEIDPVWKGLLFSLIVTLIVIVIILSIVSLFPNIPFLLLILVTIITAGLAIYWIG
ncbi:hypothetical protein KGR20_10160 [Cytobacillus oceanisediminis]|uniref:Uncharacterized protein n=1 Tax=Niallia alba TaxID=2729105 RepID=A0A7Y0KBH1_9BACI|nr:MULTISPECIES: hypothetical protein [Bacillaceae]MBQ6445957.1 hypothetical protein [Bacillus sp. (in: firmicutes)]MBZ9534617.1 hypothetical protein [Cytobacillus oceanisediminis]MDU1848179.1 hypothetical protein [Niallia nealsonii]NMO79063.1 hypothetical protein [Niallia alba]